MTNVTKALKDTEDLRVAASVGSLGGSTFQYAYLIANDRPYASGWWLLFYNSILFTVVTGISSDV